MTTTSAKDGSFSFAKVPYGKWIVREIEQPKGFVLDEKAYEVNISEAEQVVEIEIVSVNENGTAVMKSDLPFGKYYVKEIATDEHYVLSDTKYPVVFEYAG